MEYFYTIRFGGFVLLFTGIIELIAWGIGNPVNGAILGMGFIALGIGLVMDYTDWKDSLKDS